MHPGRSQVGRRSSESSFSRIIHEIRGSWTSSLTASPCGPRLRQGSLGSTHTHTHFQGIIKAEGSGHVGEDQRGHATVREQQMIVSLFLTL